MKRIYISGPMAGLEPEEITERFKAGEKFLRSALTDDTWEVVNPAEIYPGADPNSFDHEEWMRIDTTLLSMCDAIFMLPGWEASEGAKEEHAFAGECGLAVYGFAGAETVSVPADRNYKCIEIEAAKDTAEDLVEAARRLIDRASLATEENEEQD